MKRIIIIIALFTALSCLTGCSALFTNSDKFREGNWIGFASSEEAAKITQQAMAINKMDKTSSPSKLKLRVEKFDSLLVTLKLSELQQFAYLDSSGETIVINFEKAGQSSALIDPIMGYKGIVANTSHYATVNIIIRGPETKSYVLPPGGWTEDYLIPGDYKATSYYRGQKIGFWEFTSGLQIQEYLGKKVHWHTYCDY